MRLAIVVDDSMVIRRRRWAWEGRRRLCVEMSGGILVEVLELFALVVVKGVLSKACVSLVIQQENAASQMGCRTRHGKRGEKAGSMKSRIKYKYSGNERRSRAAQMSYRRRGVVEILGSGRVGMRGCQRSDAQRELVKGRLLRRPCEIRSVL